MVSDKVKNLIIITIITVVGVFYLSTMREGHDWGDDFSAYINHAKNITKVLGPGYIRPSFLFY